jgi:hypothetical protein
MAATETPATKAARAACVEFSVHEYEHDARAPAFGLEAAVGKHVEMAPAESVTDYVAARPARGG